ncbi:Peptidase M23 [Halothece sp. PCC 7418]|uniref:M23 family metallopeptidase n=1 Tax=Halothece sp. (strain PCC 7418) TaxID=65093 RepID=UPI0002A07F4A|nr:M23 family metallopeptidase [Halothece sp. PCC 7418]AFZ45626.1 Peptidase M23 [Halothece sp. PCC 7418]
MGWQIKGYGLLLGLFTLALPAEALEVKINPDNPQLGDTVSVTMETDPNEVKPQVTWGDESYPVFAVGNNLYRTLIPTTPLDDSGKVPLTIRGEQTTRNFLVWLRDRAFPTQRIWLSGSNNRPATELELNRVAQFKKLVTPQQYWTGTFVRPNRGRVSTVFGVRRYYNGEFAENYYHKGVDYAAGTGSPVVAPANGRIALVGKESEGFHVHGNTIGIDHGQGVLSIFLHLNDINVQEGERVIAGQKIGTVGSTGASTGPHLHWGLYVNGRAIDPAPWRFQEIQ